MDGLFFFLALFFSLVTLADIILYVIRDKD